MPAEASAICPKHMTYGPCGGVRDDGACEIDATHPCPFVPLPTVRWAGVETDGSLGRPVSGSLSERSESKGHPDPWVPERGAAESKGAPTKLLALLATRPLVVADLPARALDAAAITACGDLLRDHVDAVLAGDSGSARVQFPPAYRARLLLDAGLLPWVGLNCRDRNRVAIEAEFAALVHAGAAAVHCVTGDHTLTGSRPDAQPVFDLDSTELAALGRAAGLLVSVGETPPAPPIERRPDRLLEKQRAGAQFAFVNHAGGAGPVADFIARSRAVGVTLDFIPCIPIVVDEASAEMLRSFSAPLPPGYLAGIMASRDPRAAGIEAAIALADEFLAIEGVVGVNLSGGPTTSDADLDFARVLADIGAEVRRRHPGRAA